MTASEFAFLALGLVLGVASGSALVMVMGARPAAREVRLTVEHGAVPRRAATLSSDAFVTHTAEPARGGPADRRRLDRDDPPADPPPPGSLGWPAPIMAATADRYRTTVPFAAPMPVASGIPIVPERDPALDALRVRAALAAERLYRTGMPTATALLETRSEAADAPGAPNGAPIQAPVTEPTARPEPAVDGADPDVPALVRILRGDHQALFAATAALAGTDAAERRPWHASILALVSAIADRAVRAGWLDFPVGNPFWDTFTVPQCREIAGALAGLGYRFDGVDGWADGHVPTYRDLTAAVAAAGLEPRRIRAWPTQEEIASLYREVTIATDDFLTAEAPTMDLEEVRALAAGGGSDLKRLWSSWDRVRATLMEPRTRA
ncbi:MAG: hypothetical protein HY264_02130 [Chloroflexi bacterium]|nr:hypothetical protein [Chloroflexota bacterium]